MVLPATGKMRPFLAARPRLRRQTAACERPGRPDRGAVSLNSRGASVHDSTPRSFRLGRVAHKIFIDVGAHDGGTLFAVQSPKWGFREIHCLEPASAWWSVLDEVASRDGRVRIHRVGLSNATEERELFNPGSTGASIYADKGTGEIADREPIQLVRASDWVRANVPTGAVAYMKLNCEGAECDIVDDLIDTGEIERLASVNIDFDVRKIRSQRHREREVRERIAAAGLTNCVFAHDVMVGDTHRARVENWLTSVEAGDESVAGTIRHVRFLAARRARRTLRR